MQGRFAQRPVARNELMFQEHRFSISVVMDVSLAQKLAKKRIHRFVVEY